MGTCKRYNYAYESLVVQCERRNITHPAFAKCWGTFGGMSAPATLPTPAEVEAAMLQMMVNDTATMKDGEAKLRQYLKLPAIVGVLLTLVDKSTHAPVSFVVSTRPCSFGRSFLVVLHVYRMVLLGTASGCTVHAPANQRGVDSFVDRTAD
jgi:hypothetical protein